MGRWGEYYRGRGRGWIQVPGRGDATKLWRLIQAEARMVEAGRGCNGRTAKAGRRSQGCAAKATEPGWRDGGSVRKWCGVAVRQQAKATELWHQELGRH